MAKVTLADRLAIRMPAQPQQAPNPAPKKAAPGSAGPKPPKPPQPKAGAAAKVPGVNAKTDGDNSAETFNNAPQAPKTGRPMKDPKQPLQKALTDAQKHKIMTEVNQNLGQKNLASNDPALQQTGREQVAKYVMPGDAAPQMPTAVTQVKKPGAPAPALDGDKTSNLKVGGDKTAALTISSQKTAPLAVNKTPTGTQALATDPDTTGTLGSAPKAAAQPARAPSPILHAHRKAEMARINTEFAYKNIKSKDASVKKMGHNQLKEVPLKEKIRYRGNQVVGVLRNAMAKSEEAMAKNVEDTVKDPPKASPTSLKGKKPKKDKYEPSIRVTQSYSSPGRFDAGKFVMNVLGHGSPVANRILSAAKNSVTKSTLEEEWEQLSKNEQFVKQHTDMLKQIDEGSIDAAALVRLLKKD